MPARIVSEQMVAEIRELRYGDGLSSTAVCARLGVSERTVRVYAPGWPGRVPNDKARAMFERSSLTAVEVARRMGWWKRNGGRHESPDSVRVRRTLGLADEVSRGHICRRSLIDAETAGDLAEAMGHARWEALPEDQWA